MHHVQERYAPWSLPKRFSRLRWLSKPPHQCHLERLQPARSRSSSRSVLGSRASNQCIERAAHSAAAHLQYVHVDHGRRHFRMPLSSTRPNTLRQIARLQFDALLATALVRRGRSVISLVCTRPNSKFNRTACAGRRSTKRSASQAALAQS